MKQLLLVLLGIIFTTTIDAQHLSEDYLATKLIIGYPPEASFFVQQYKPAQLKYTSLETGTDSLRVIIGSFMIDQNKDYYAIIVHNKKFDFTTFNLDRNDSSKILAKKLDFKVNNSIKSLSLQVQHNPATDEVFYMWLNQNGSSKIASMQLEGLIQQNQPMPYFEVKTLNGEIISFKDLKGKYLVINWWATSCGPCIAEMPVLNNIVEKYKSRTDVVFIAMAWDEKEKLERFLTKRHFKYQQTYNRELTSIFGESFPKHVIVNPQGIVTYYKSGLEYEILEGKAIVKKNLQIEQAIEKQLGTN